ncbi:uncharacterized protein [Littorina saxatilis]|uniref:Uncharacterized protein n=1 Tax=Littorina saxatilis TaxID=31220 RepID=A0AAN9B6J9_9CAEN
MRFGRIVRQPDKSATQRRDKSGPGGRREKDKNQRPELCGWNLPALRDNDDIMTWMKREKNGDNNRKKVNEVYEEEQYRHNSSGHCSGIENKLLFDRQSLHDRYLKNCQFGVRNSRASKVTPVTSLKTIKSNGPPSQQGVDRNCYSATALVDENEDDEEAGLTDANVRPDVSRGRSHSAVCHSALLRVHGMTLPADSRLVTNTDDFVKDESEDAVWDEGYESKVSSNDQEQDGAEEESVKTLDDSELSHRQGELSLHKVGPVLQAGPGHPLSHQDAVAKLMYSRREKTVYERLPSRGLRGNSFRYAGREQSRLIEASLNNITPAYLARYHHLADLAHPAQTKQSQTAKLSHSQSDTALSQQQLLQQQSVDGGGAAVLQPRTMVLRKVTIQDTARDLFSQNILPQTPKATPVKQSSDKIVRRQGLQLSPPGTHSERSVSETRSNVSDTATSSVSEQTRTGGISEITISELTQYSGMSEITLSRVSGPPKSKVSELTIPELSEQVSVRVQAITPDLVLCDAYSSRTATTTAASSAQTKSARSVANKTDDPQGTTPVTLTPSAINSPPSSDRLTMSTFAVTDLLPAVERSIRIQRHTQRDLSKSKSTLDVTASLNNLNSRNRQQQLQRQQQQQLQQSNSKENEALETPGRDDGLGVGVGVGVGGVSQPNGTRIASKRGSSEDVRGFPAFKPHNNISPLQRAKEIANRRLHGHVTQQPDGSETVRVPSPRYASRGDQKQSYTRTKSASRLLGQVMARQVVGYHNSTA